MEGHKKALTNQLCLGCLLPVYKRDCRWHTMCRYKCQQVIQCHRSDCRGSRPHVCALCNKGNVCEGKEWKTIFVYCRTCRITVCDACRTGCDLCERSGFVSCPKCRPGPLSIQTKRCTVCVETVARASNVRATQ